MRYLISLLFAISLTCSFSQNEGLYAQLEVEIQEAVNNQNYELAASLKKERALRREIDEAVKNEEFQKAANLKKELELLDSVKNRKIQALDQQIKAATEAEDYEKAAALKKEKEALISGKAEKETAVESDKEDVFTLTPPFNNQIYVLEENRLVNLEKRNAKSTKNNFDYSSGDAYFFISGSNSSRKIDANAEFVIKFNEETNPKELISLVRFEAGKGGLDRYVSKGDMQTISVKFAKQSNGTWKIGLNESLSDGEYGFKMDNSFYCFRIGKIQYTENNNSPDTYESRYRGDQDELFENGFTLDFLAGVGLLNKRMEYVNSTYNNPGKSSPSLPTFNLIIGTKFYFGSNDKFRLGLQANWFRFGNYLNLNYFEESIINLNPLNPGVTFVYKFKENVGIEASFVTGMFLFSTYEALFGNSLLPEIRGININPSIKFRYKKLSAGLDYLMQNQIGNNYDYGGGYRMSTISLNVGLKL